MSYTNAWLEAHHTPDAELRERLHDALVRAHEAEDTLAEAAVVLEDYGDDLVDAATAAFEAVSDAEDAQQTAEDCLEEELQKAAGFETERAGWKEEKATLVRVHDEMMQEMDRKLAAATALQGAQAELAPQIREMETGAALPSNVIRVNFNKDGERRALELYAEACKLDEKPDTQAEAERLYRRALVLDPGMGIARTNLGNVLFRTGRVEEAEREYRQATIDEPKCAEAHYKLGYLMLDRGKPREAVTHFLVAIQWDGRFADAYFNCAMALEQASDPHTAKWHWAKYIELEPKGTWADIARKHLVAPALLTAKPADGKRYRARRKGASAPEGGTP